MKSVLNSLILLAFGGALASMLTVRNNIDNSWAGFATSKFRHDAAGFAQSAQVLKLAIQQLRAADPSSLIKAKAALQDCRLAYKQVEYFMEYFFEYPVNMYNRAPVYEIEEPYMEYQSPVGLQVIEDILFGNEAFQRQQDLLRQIEVVASTAADIPATLHQFKATDAQVAESIAREITRVLALGITGYDAPKLKSGMAESAAALIAVKETLQWYAQHNPAVLTDSLWWYLDKSIALLCASDNFDTFDRLHFLTTAGLPLQRQVNRLLITQFAPTFSHTGYQYAKGDLFNPQAIQPAYYSDHSQADSDRAMIVLGKQLFSEPLLSGSGKRSCATCHQPGRYFTDGLEKSMGIDGHSHTTRNAPSLLYAAYQYGQFWDARAPQLEHQIIAVLQSPVEMNASLPQVIQNINTRDYRRLFKKAFPRVRQKQLITIATLSQALAAYERTLAPFRSAFDKYMAGDTRALTAAQIKGFNLFAGKAQCATCHFFPLFNGLLPPLYNRTELEVLGVPVNGDLQHPLRDTDSGRYTVLPIEYYNGAFKTPTVRNASVTAPYMHNGSLRTLEDVVAFYNRGGGAGIGLHVPAQTLSPLSLQLTQDEISQLIHFMQALKDDM